MIYLPSKVPFSTVISVVSLICSVYFFYLLSKTAIPVLAFYAILFLYFILNVGILNKVPAKRHYILATTSWVALLIMTILL